MDSIIYKFKTIGLKLADVKIFIFSLLWLMFLLISGTIAQRSIGLFRAQEKYFSSFILWIGPVPTPGGYTIMIIIFLGLLSLLVFKQYNWKKNAGVIITHIGALILFIGGFITSIFSIEGSLVIPEGQVRNIVQEYHSKELVIKQKISAKEISFSIKNLKENNVIELNDLFLQIEIIKIYKNYKLSKRKNLSGKEFKGIAKQYLLNTATLSKKKENSNLALEIRILNAKKSENGIYYILENRSKALKIVTNKNVLSLSIRKSQFYLPFSIKLINFEEQKHPGTSMSKSFKSEVLILDKGIKQRAVISMNKPLRYKDYTFYQSSFSRTKSHETTVLAVVKNAGKMFPYISSLIMCIGLLLHLLTKSQALFRKKEVLKK